ncbi:NAD(P)-binding protein [Sphingobium sp. B8D3D]|uniref:NAD(P)-binding protein n=2 Tax=unclassified Sphingobium TaxID=2611147 RepID=UPI002224FB15|nr:NAD(P)/FAD-dependent oxidoreductase [Sphingobium sp. B8D3D]MCW2413357.1 spermidine dehydrogenase [Sphingobium sp. B8D3D]MCW2414344.1 spermidine dehydrogenase [Sphingobium sp. B8D3A]
MSVGDKNLGMDRPIQRRDFIQGVAVTAGGAMAAASAGPAIAAKARAAAFANADGSATPETYPPLRTGMRGQHPGAFEGAHALRDGESFPGAEDTKESYDLVVVGGGLSGLAAAYFFRKRAGPNARILILDNHDDFGGHAKRNEFLYNSKQLIANGGSSYMVAPSKWTYESISLIRELGIEKGTPTDRVDGQLYRSLGMQPATFFRKQVYGADKLVPGGTPTSPTAQWLAQTPFPKQVKDDLLRITTASIDYMSGLTPAEKTARLQAMSYRDYLLNVAKVHPDVVPLMQGMWCLGADMGTAWFAFFRMRPGFQGLGLERPALSPESEEHRLDDFSLPAGNSDIARLIVRALIPDALAPGDFAAVETKRVNYAALDRAQQPTRIRLSSVVIRVKHAATAGRLFDPDNSECEITYMSGGKAKLVRGANVVLACMNNIVPYLVPELPEEQKTALHAAVRAVNQETNVLFRNWEPFAKLKTNAVTFPNSFYGRMSLAAQRYLGDLVPSRTPSEPIVVSFGTGANSGICSNSTMLGELMGGSPPEPGTPADDQFRMARMGLLQTPFEHFERAIRSQAAAALSGTGFDPARDILAITVNRWAHGFTTGRNSLFEPDKLGQTSPVVTARAPFGRITIANSDAGGVSTAGTAIDEAFRAVRELEQNQIGFYEQI